MAPIISANGLGKTYRIGRRSRDDYRTLRESLMDVISLPWRALSRLSQGERRARVVGDTQATKDEFWALRDVSFEVQPGEVMGIVGPNGAGKSTLLKILSRITEPSQGLVEMHGRVGSLLEVGTGFHPELTGRENIFLNGAILGMTRREIVRKFDEIVAFAEIERFLETPVKRYSSGMYVRLAFAVASHLEPEILVVDEVLAVGDAAFQRKCLGKMNQVRRSGRTVLFVSHNMAALKSLCTRAILIKEGCLSLDGDVDDVVNLYLNSGPTSTRSGIIPESASRFQDVDDEARFVAVRMTDRSNRQLSQLHFGQPFRVHLTCDVLKDIDDVHFEVSISTLDGTHVIYSTTLDGGSDSIPLRKGRHELFAEFDTVLLPRDYTIDLGLHHQGGTTADFVQRVYDFEVLKIAENGQDHYRWNKVRGLVRAPAHWNLESLQQTIPPSTTGRKENSTTNTEAVGYSVTEINPESAHLGERAYA